MIETQVRALFTSIAEGEPTPSRVDTELAHRRGRARLRWRRASQAGAPVMAAAAVVAVILAVGAVPFRPGPSPSTTVPTVAPRIFSPLVPYASFGWLPAGDSLRSGNSARTLTSQAAGPSPAKTPWTLVVFAGGTCRPSVPAQHLHCRVGQLPETVLPLGSRAPAVHGRPAYWARADQAPTSVRYLIWQYARGGWALLSWNNPGSRGSAWQPLAVRIAANVRYGAHAAPPLAFPARLTGVPASWQVSAVMYQPHGTVLLARQYTVTAGPADLNPDGPTPFGVPVINIRPASARGSCHFSPGESARKVLGGYQAIVSHFAAPPLNQLLCAKHADGLWVTIWVYAKAPVLGVADLFAHHMKLLGPDPAHWARNPIG